MPLNVRKFLKEYLPGHHVQAETIAAPTHIQACEATPNLGQPPTYIQACVTTRKVDQNQTSLKYIPVVTKPYVSPTYPSGLPRMLTVDTRRATHFKYYVGKGRPFIPLPDTYPEGSEPWNDEDWKKRAVSANDDIHLFTTPGSDVIFVLKVSRDEDKWVYQDFDPDSKLVSEPELHAHVDELISKFRKDIEDVFTPQ